MKTGRHYHSMTILGGQMVVAGGENIDILTSVETLNTTNWVETDNLNGGRSQHAAVMIDAGLIFC